MAERNFDWGMLRMDDSAVYPSPLAYYGPYDSVDAAYTAISAAFTDLGVSIPVGLKFGVKANDEFKEYCFKTGITKDDIVEVGGMTDAEKARLATAENNIATLQENAGKGSTALAAEISRAKAAEQANTDAIAVVSAEASAAQEAATAASTSAEAAQSSATEAQAAADAAEDHLATLQEEIAALPQGSTTMDAKVAENTAAINEIKTTESIGPDNIKSSKTKRTETDVEYTKEMDARTWYGSSDGTISSAGSTSYPWCADYSNIIVQVSAFADVLHISFPAASMPSTSRGILLLGDGTAKGCNFLTGGAFNSDSIQSGAYSDYGITYESGEILIDKEVLVAKVPTVAGIFVDVPTDGISVKDVKEETVTKSLEWLDLSDNDDIKAINDELDGGIGIDNMDGSFKKYDYGQSDGITQAEKMFQATNSGTTLAEVSGGSRVMIPVSGRTKIYLSKDALPSATKCIFILTSLTAGGRALTSDETYYAYSTTNETYRSFTEETDDYYAYDIAAMQDAYPNVAYVALNVATGMESYCGDSITANERKSLDWLDVSENETLLNTIGQKKVEDYYTEEKEKTVEKLTSLDASSNFSLNILTDSHINPEGSYSIYAQQKDTLANLKRLNISYPSDGVIHLGDYLLQDLYWGNNAIINEALHIVREGMYDANDNAYMLIGNHDGISGGVATTDGEYNLMGRSKVTRGYNSNHKPRPYFYFDNDDKKVRCLCLAVPFVDADNTDAWNVDSSQLAFFLTALNSCPADYHVFVFCHVHPYLNEVYTNGGMQTMAGMLKAFNAHTTYSGGGITADFTDKTSNKIVAWICGHCHYDAVSPDGGDVYAYAVGSQVEAVRTNGLGFPIVVCAATCYTGTSEMRYPTSGSTVYYVIPKRTWGTVNDECWDTMVYQRDLGKLTFVRFGSSASINVDSDGDRVVNV